MKIGIVGGGIVGTAIAATLKKYSLLVQRDHPLFDVSVSIIDDHRPHQTSQAGQGYLWSIHRCNDEDEVRRSFEAKSAWKELLENCVGGVDNLLEERGSLLIAPSNKYSKVLREYRNLGNKIDSFQGQIEFIEDASALNPFLKADRYCGLYYPSDLVCVPTDIIQALRDTYDIHEERRRVTCLQLEKEKYDIVVCCTGPWIKELYDVNVVPIRGILLHVFPGEAISNVESIKKSIPTMEWGYGVPGLHFTMSSRGVTWLVGASREDVGFDITHNLDDVTDNLMKHATNFLKSSVLSSISKRTIGFRPLLKRKENARHSSYEINNKDGLFLCFGFEGQGVLFAAHAAAQVMKNILDYLNDE